MVYEEMKLEGLYRTVKRPYGHWKKVKKEDEGRKFVSDGLQPLFRITEQEIENGKYLVSARFAKFIPVDEWKQYPCYGKRTINFMS